MLPEVFNANLATISTGLKGIGMESAEVDKFLKKLEYMTEGLGVSSGAANGQPPLVREIHGHQVGGSHAGAVFAKHQSLARTTVLEIVEQLARGFEEYFKTMRDYVADVQRTDEDNEVVLTKLGKIEETVVVPPVIDPNAPQTPTATPPPATGPSVPTDTAPPAAPADPAATTDTTTEVEA